MPVPGFPYGNPNPYGPQPVTPPIGTGIPAGGGNTVPYVPTNIPTTTTQSNVADIPNLETLTKAINDLNIAAQQQANVSRIPGEAGLEQQSSANIASELGGQVPPDVEALLRQQGAEQNVVSGRDSNSAYLRALGLTSLGQQQAGQQNLSAAAARNPLAPLFDPTSQLLTAGQAGQLGLGQQAENIAQQRLALEAQRLFGPSRISFSGGVPNMNIPTYSGTGGTAQVTPARTGPMGLPPGVMDYGPSGDYVDQPYQDWLDSLYGSGTDATTTNDLFPGLGGDQSLPPDWQPGVALPDYVDASLYGG